jgi:hypothetical protein
MFSAAVACSVGTPNHERSHLITSTDIAVTWVQTDDNQHTYWFDIDTEIDATVRNWGPIDVGQGDPVSYPYFNNVPGGPGFQHCFRIWTRQSPNGCRSDRPSEWTCVTQTTPPPAVEIIAPQSKCIDVPGGDAANPADGDRPQIFNCWGGSNQKWTFENGLIKSKGKCLNVSGGSEDDGTPVILWSCIGTDNEKWTYQDGHLLDPHSKCLTALSSNDTAKLVIWPCAQDLEQYWVMR